MTDPQLILKLQSDCQRLTDERDEYKNQLRQTMASLVVCESARDVKAEQVRILEDVLNEKTHDASFHRNWLILVLIAAIVELCIIIL